MRRIISIRNARVGDLNVDVLDSSVVEDRQQLVHDSQPQIMECTGDLQDSFSLHLNKKYGSIYVIMPAPQCAALKKNSDNRCSLRTRMRHPYCWIHTRQKLKVAVKDTPMIPGQKGLFALKDFKAPVRKNGLVEKGGEVICDATGIKHWEDVEPDWGDKAPDSNHYIIQTSTFAMDMEDPTRSSVARYANHCKGENVRANQCKQNAYLSNHNGKLTIRAQTKVNAGDEVFWSYGPKFWGSTGADDANKPGQKKKKEEKKGPEGKEEKYNPPPAPKKKKPVIGTFHKKKYGGRSGKDEASSFSRDVASSSSSHSFGSGIEAVRKAQLDKKRKKQQASAWRKKKQKRKPWTKADRKERRKTAHMMHMFI